VPQTHHQGASQSIRNIHTIAATLSLKKFILETRALQDCCISSCWRSVCAIQTVPCTGSKSDHFKQQFLQTLIRPRAPYTSRNNCRARKLKWGSRRFPEEQRSNKKSVIHDIVKFRLQTTKTHILFFNSSEARRSFQESRTFRITAKRSRLLLQIKKKMSELRNLFSVFQFNNQTYALCCFQTLNKNNIPISINSNSIMNQCPKLTWSHTKKTETNDKNSYSSSFQW